MELIDTDCYNCHLTTTSTYSEENGFTLVKCAECGLLYVNPRPSDKDLVQAHEYGVHGGEATLDTTGVFNTAKVIAYASKLKEIFGNELANRDRTWLDIGCGHGEFLLALNSASRGKVVGKGVEPNKRKQESARAQGLDVTFFDIGLHENQYDVVSLLNVFSHLPNPIAFLAQCKRLLKVGGVLVLETGDTADLPPEQHHRPFYLPDHLSFANKKIVCDMLIRSGFEIHKVTSFQSFTCNLDWKTWLKEFIKLAWPGKTSFFKNMISKNMESRRYVRDMYIVAILPSRKSPRPG